ncbi:hypothetical protein GCM10010492_43400 [Saccharothrix mutabilis subsp. mutabilis]|uniref:Uncharacterized protein n=1 Tax=Saccharothrix mutabilis subsp. mutabilis TaxID=66855 RepID=A0ABN0U5M4_9PSEU
MSIPDGSERNPSGAAFEVEHIGGPDGKVGDHTGAKGPGQQKEGGEESKCPADSGGRWDSRSTLARAVEDWGSTIRLIVLAAVGVLLVGSAVWLLGLDISVGPVRISRSGV